MTYLVIVHNAQGASEDMICADKQAIRDYLNSWADPENLTVQVRDADTGAELGDEEE